MRRTLFACGEVELVGVTSQVEETLLRAADTRPDLVLAALGQKLDYEALANGLAALGGIAVAGLRDGGGGGAASRREASGIPVLAAPVAFDALAALVSAAARRSAALGPSGVGGILERLIVRSKGLVRLVQVSEIVWIEALHNAVLLHTLQGEIRLRMPISALARELAPERFVRIHRSHIVNLEHVTQFRVSPQGQYAAVTPQGVALNVGRTYQGNLLLRLQRI